MQNSESNQQKKEIETPNNEKSIDPKQQQNALFEDVNNKKAQNVNQENERDRQNQNQEQNQDFKRVSSSPSSSPSSPSSQSAQQQKWEYESIKEGQNQQKGQQQQTQKNDNAQDKVVPKEKPSQKAVIRYKYCCKKCKHADRQKDKKACVCVVPRDQRRTHLGNQGCQTCGCAGCSKEDFIFRGQDPQYHPQDKKKQSKKKEISQLFQARNGCCKNCMKAFSKSNKSCICQVPESVRKTKLSSTGCKICGCIGCNPQDRKDYHKSQKRVKRSRSRSDRRKQKREKRSRSKQKKKRSKSRSPQIIDTYAMNFHNIDRSIIGSMIISEYQIDPALLGFGIPQRSSSYLFGRK